MPGTQQMLNKCLLIDLLYGNHLKEKVKDSTKLRTILEALAFGLAPVPLGQVGATTLLGSVPNPVLRLMLAPSCLAEFLLVMTMKNLVHIYM